LDSGFNGREHNPWRVRRLNIPAGIGDAAFEAWASGLALRTAFS